MNPNATIGELVVERPSRARVFEKLGIDYCCGGSKSLEKACRDRQLDLDNVVDELNEEQSSGDSAARNWGSASLTDLCDHIEQTHHRALKEELPRLEALAGKVANRHGGKRPALIGVQQIVADLRAELESHMAQEERVLFPLCRRLDVADSLPALYGGGVATPIEAMMDEHEHAGDALAQLRTLTNGFTSPADACNSFRALYDGLEHLERDLHEHVHKENNILFPRAVRMERLLAASRVA